jgi:hypothetical protein
MRFACLFSLILAVAGMAAAQQQETNFAVGPQYLITQPYPTILQPIATPSMEAWQQPGVVSPETGVAGPVMINIPAYLPWVYWGYTPPGAVQLVPGPEPLAEPVPSGLPQGYINLGVTAIATPIWLHDHEYGMSLAQVAQYWKAQHLHATHVYTNADIERLNGH